MTPPPPDGQAAQTPWRQTAQVQIEHMSGYCTLSTAIAYPGGEMQVNQRIEDTPKGYATGQQRAAYIVWAANCHEALVEALAEAIYQLKCSGHCHDHPTVVGLQRALTAAQAKGTPWP